MTTTDTPPRTRRRVLEGGEGSTADAFGAREWGTLGLIAVIWGSSFVLIEIGLRGLPPGTVALARVGLGAVTLAAFPRARTPIGDRGDLLRIAALGWIWIGVPFLLFPIAQQHVTSAVAGMINGGMPVASAAWATLLLRRLPGRVQRVGITLGFLGIVLVFLPELQVSQASAFGAALLLLAITLYGLSTNLVVPLQQRHGGLAVVWRAQLSALALVAPVGLWQAQDATWRLDSVLAMLPLGVLGTGIALALMADLVGRVGSSRGSVAIYLVPVVAVALGVTLLDEPVDPIAIGGLVLILFGAFLTSRRETVASASGQPVPVEAQPEP